jgi:hypothetical protein
VRGEKEIKSMQKEKIGDVIFFLDCKEDRSEDLCAKEKKNNSNLLSLCIFVLNVSTIVC